MKTLKDLMGDSKAIKRQAFDGHRTFDLMLRCKQTKQELRISREFPVSEMVDGQDAVRKSLHESLDVLIDRFLAR